MPPLPDAAAIVRIRVGGTIDTEVFNNIFHVQYSGGAPSVVSLSSVCSDFATAYNDNFLALIPTSVTVTTVEAQDLTTPLASQASISFSEAGTRSGTSFPNNVAVCVSWKINVRYRGGHPRTYLPGGVLADLNGGNRWSDAFVTAAEGAADSFLDDVNAITAGGSTYKLVCLSYVRNKIALVPPVPYTIQSVVVDHRPDTQRRRLGRDLAA